MSITMKMQYNVKWHFIKCNIWAHYAESKYAGCQYSEWVSASLSLA